MTDTTPTWTFSPTPPLTVMNCSTIPNELALVGGYKHFYYQQSMSKQFLNIPSHSSIMVNFTLYLLDSWNSQYFQVSFDGVLVSNTAYSTNSAINICGGSAPDTLVNVSITQPHSASTFTLKLQSQITLSSDYGVTLSWGIRDLVISIQTSCPNLCQDCTGQVCNNLAQFATQDPTTYAITCKSGFYVDNDGNRCNVCHYSCNTCLGPGPNNCSLCNGDDILNSTANSCSFKSKIKFFQNKRNF